LPILRTTPGLDPNGGPLLIGDLFATLGSGSNDITVEPLAAGANPVLVVLRDAGLASNSVNAPSGAGTVMLAVLAPSTLEGRTGTSVPIVEPGVPTFQIADFSRSGGGVLGTYGALTLAPGGADTILPVGTADVTAAFPGPGSILGIRSPRSGLSGLLLAQIQGDPANPAGTTLTYSMLVNGVPVPGSSVTLPADTGGAGVASFVGWFSRGDLLQVLVHPSAVLRGSNIVQQVSLA
jgi:hypothetical protein